jgi:hypothetical protein
MKFIIFLWAVIMVLTVDASVHKQGKKIEKQVKQSTEELEKLGQMKLETM